MIDARIPDGLTAIRQGWTLDDLVHAHQFLDELDAAEARRQAELREARALQGRSRR